MTTRRRCLAALALTALLPPGAPSAQTDEDLQRIKRHFSGQQILVTYRDGEAVYGTYYFIDFHLCPSSQYLSFGQSRKQTVLGNQQVNNWRDQGRWDVLRVQGQIRLAWLSVSGERDFIPLQLLPDGSIRTGGRASIQPQGRAQCR
jgi:hypothetical protein